MLDLLHDALDRLGLVDESIGAKAHRLHAALVTTSARVNDHRRVDLALLQSPQHLETIDARHFEIEDDAVDRFAAQDVEPFAAAAGNGGLIAADAFQVVGILLGHCRGVVDDENVKRHVRAGGSAGMSMTMRVPRPGALSTLMRPLKSITSRRTIESPRPVPPAFVV